MDVRVSRMTAPLDLKLEPRGMLVAQCITVVVVILKSGLNAPPFVEKGGQSGG